MDNMEKQLRTKRKVNIFLLGTIILAVTTLLFSGFINILMISLSNRDIYDCDEIENADLSADYAIILGCRVHSDQTPSTMLKHRLDTGAELYFNGKVKKIIVSGNPSDSFNNEPEAMKTYLVSIGVSEQDILLDNGGLSTYDTMKRAAEVFGVSDAVVVTQKYHLYRAMYIGNLSGIDVQGASATLGEYHNQLRYDVREYLARCKDFFMVLFDISYAD